MAKIARAALISAFAVLTASAQNTEIHVLCSNGFRAAMNKLLPQSERAISGTAKIDFGASRNLKQSIEQGQPFDVVIVTPQVIEELIKDGKVASGTEVNLASSGIGVAVRAGRPKPDVSTVQDIKQTLLGAKSIGYVKVGAGTPAILDMFQKLGIAQALQDKTVYQAGAEQSMKNLAAGNVDIALALISEILPAPGVQLAGPLPAEFQKRIVLAAGIASSTKKRAAAEQFIKSLTGASAAKTIKASGMEPAPKEN